MRLAPGTQAANIFGGGQNYCKLLLYLATEKRIGAFTMFVKICRVEGAIVWNTSFEKAVVRFAVFLPFPRKIDIFIHN